jgi:signal transduction histidine kinase
MALSFKNRIAFLYLISTALLVLFVYVLIYLIVNQSVYSHLDSDISAEVKDLMSEIKFTDGNFAFVDAEEWKEREHNTLNVNPIYIQILDASKHPIDKSPNLKNESLEYHEFEKDNSYYNTGLKQQKIRQTQFSIVRNGKISGYFLVAMSLEDANYVLSNLTDVLLVSFPLVLLTLFIITRLIAGRSIRPITKITDTTREITEENLGLRVELPPNKDEIYVLSTTINNLLGRIENAIIREKQFTSDASHELRTPLAVVKGTLEVLIRKPRDTEEYKEKIMYCINEVDRLNNLVDQLLLLARFENQKIAAKKEMIALNEVIMESLERFSSKIESSAITIDFTFDRHFYINSDGYLISIVISNLLSNALKYSNTGSNVKIALSEDDKTVTCIIADNGIGIPAADIEKVFEQFYRSHAHEHPNIKGNGLGLSLVKRLCELLNTKLTIKSRVGEGTKATLLFPKD